MSDLELVDPETHERLRRANAEELEAVARAIREGRARRGADGELPARLDGAYLAHGGRRIYPIVDGIPSLLVEERIELDIPA